MIELSLEAADLARIRFAHSPVWELMTSVRALQDRHRHHIYRRWFSTVDSRVAGLRIDLLTELIPATSCVPDFLTPPPTTVESDLADELATVASTDPGVVRAQLARLSTDRPMASRVRRLYDDPARHLGEVVEQMDRYWHAAIGPVWSRVRSIGLADVNHRTRQFAEGGVAKVLSGLHPGLLFDGDRVIVRKTLSWRKPTGGNGILLIPCVFAWPDVLITGCESAQATVCYPPRMAADVSERPPSTEDSALGAVLGRTRAAMLASLELPYTTTQLAQQFAMSPGSVSQHLKILTESALVDRHRRGRSVLYQRTTLATALLHASGRLTNGRPGCGAGSPR
jgi:DNA-binding transcriptional ArsR family regulator